MKIIEVGRSYEEAYEIWKNKSDEEKQKASRNYMCNSPKYNYHLKLEFSEIQLFAFSSILRDVIKDYENHGRPDYIEGLRLLYLWLNDAEAVPNEEVKR